MFLPRTLEMLLLSLSDPSEWKVRRMSTIFLQLSQSRSFIAQYFIFSSAIAAIFKAKLPFLSLSFSLFSFLYDDECPNSNCVACFGFQRFLAAFSSPSDANNWLESVTRMCVFHRLLFSLFFSVECLRNSVKVRSGSLWQRRVKRSKD